MAGQLIFDEQEMDFIKHHHLSLGDFYDARGESKSLYHNNAKQAGCNFVIHNKCREGHRLKSRSGHCIICRPAAISFQKRNSRSGILYIAVSGEMCKVGVVDNNSDNITRTLFNRNNSLNAEGGYGGCNNWTIIKHYKIDKDLGRVESMIHERLSKYKKCLSYIHSGCPTIANELFKCTAETAIAAAKSVLAKY